MENNDLDMEMTDLNDVGLFEDLFANFDTLLEEAEEEEEKRLPAYYNVSLVQKDGKYAFYDNEKNVFITFECKGVPGGVISTMVACEPLMAPPCRHWQSDELEGEEVQLGWKYKLGNGVTDHWGWISEDCTLVSKPEFSEIEVHCDGETYRREDMRLLARHWLGIYCSDGWSPLVQAFKNVNEKPLEEFRVESEFDWYLLTWYREEGGCAGQLVYRCEYRDTRFELSFEQGVLKIKDGWNDPGQVYLRKNMHLNTCTECFTYKKEEGVPPHQLTNVYLKPGEYTEACMLCGEDEDDTWYGVRQKDGYWAVLRTRSSYGEMGRWLCTPAAFTHVRKLDLYAGIVAVERFGKWGVYDIRNDTYPVPCEYETVSLKRDGILEVCRMDFKGEVDFGGKWCKHLRREEG